MKIAVASSGLGHVARGIETWAGDTASALAERGADATLFSGADMGDRAGADAVPVRCLNRGDRTARLLAKVTPGPLWRFGLKSDYGWEQFSFWRSLRPLLVEGRYDVLHVQDPMIAFWCRRARLAGKVPTKEILAHGTEEPLEFLRQFDYVQHLAPWHLEECAAGVARPYWTAIPNFVDTDRFHPDTQGVGRQELRSRLGIEPGVTVFLAVAAVKRRHKRIGYLTREFAAYLRAGGVNAVLLVAGARTDDTEELERMAGELAAGRVKILLDVARDDMPDLYRAADVFVHASLFEMMPIAFLEAMASGLPMICNDHPVMEWMVGDGGTCTDISREGQLADQLAAVTPERLVAHGRAARAHALAMFAKEAVIGQYVTYYERVIADNG